jgi:hypothetical protein
MTFYKVENFSVTVVQAVLHMARTKRMRQQIAGKWLECFAKIEKGSSKM